MLKKKLNDFFKEKKDIKRVIWKKGGEEEIFSEARMLYWLEKEGYKVPKMLEYSKEKVIMEYIPGISLFQAMQYFHRKKEKEKIKELAKYLLEGVSSFQKDTEKMIKNVSPYPVKRKLEDAFQLLSDFSYIDQKKNKKIIEYAGKLYEEEANVLFRDATPKNYFLQETYFQNLPHMSIEKLKKRIIWIDFSTVRYRTMSIDDRASILFHYMVPEEMRSEFQNMKLKDELGLLVRLTRFWARRYYYKKYHPEMFKKRYKGEDVDFYEKEFKKCLMKVYNFV